MSLYFFVNGQERELTSFEPAQSFSSWLQNKGYQGVKTACNVGGCGSCTVLQSYFDLTLKKVVHRPVLACLLPLAAAHGTHITTVEGVGTADDLHPIQERIVEMSATQCGFCTPGIVMHIYAFLLNNPSPTSRDIEDSFSTAPNLCRCTGYRPILEAAKSFAVDSSSNCSSCNFSLSFPPSLVSFDRYLSYSSPTCKWFAPSSLHELLSLKSTYTKAKLVGGNSELGVQRNVNNHEPEVLIYTNNIQDLATLSLSGRSIYIGGGITISSMVDGLEALNLPPSKFQSSRALIDQTAHFASGHIKSIATVAGNVVTASPVSDLLPVFIATNSVFVISKLEGDVIKSRKVKATDWVIGYRQVDLNDDEILVGIEMPLGVPNEFIKSFKVSKRKEDDIAVVNGCIRFKLTPSSNQSFLIEDSSIVFGGMAPTTKICNVTQELLQHKPFASETLPAILESLAKELKLSPNAPGGMVRFRMVTCGTFFSEFWNEVESKMLKNSSRNGKSHTTRPLFSSKQEFTEKSSIVGSNRVSKSSVSHVTGNTTYSIDLKGPDSTLFAAIVPSPTASGRLTSIDYTKALQMPGVTHVITAKDLKFAKKFGPILQDEDILAVEHVVYQGQPVALILAESRDEAYKAVKNVVVTVEPTSPILTIEDAITNNKYLTEEKVLEQGDLNEMKKLADVVVSGEIKLKEQEHFYFETQNSLIIPDQEFIVHASTQNPTETQHAVAHALGVPFNRVVVKVRQLGGGFGGKEVALLVPSLNAVAVQVAKRPVKMVLSRQEDMVISGKQHPMLIKYEAGFSNKGEFLFRDIYIYTNGGCSLDLSPAILERTLFHSDGVYKARASRIRGKVCFTNKPSFTALRGFGAPNGLLVAEEIMSRAAIKLGFTDEELKELNFYQEGDVTHFNMPLEYCNIIPSWNQCKQSCEFERRSKAIELFNASDPIIKRGISMQAVKFGISFTKTFMNKAAALVHCYTDGSVYISHGGVEMGNAIHTKIAQIAAQTLGVSIDDIHVSETSTDKTANTSPTAASTGSDLNGKAVEDACLQILKNLEPLKEKFPKDDFKQLCSKAFFERICTSAVGYYKTPIKGWDFEKSTGEPFYYYTYGSACVESEVNTKTGEVSVVRADIVMDVGDSLAPNLDIGQIEGAFVQGLGWMTMEEVVRNPTGKVLNSGPEGYKIPAFADIPNDFRVTLMNSVPNPKAVGFSKGVGEPPLSLCGSVYMSIKNAINSYRKTKDLSPVSSFSFPASVERVRLACPDEVSRVMTSVLEKGEEKEDW
ncbi:hypothetical protein P9112_006724 [Eukaryota sp. TZLM1-RC]